MVILENCLTINDYANQQKALIHGKGSCTCCVTLATSRQQWLLFIVVLTSRDITQAYARELLIVSKKLMGALSEGLGLGEAALQEAFGSEVGTCMRVNYYPKCPQPELALGLSAHSDPGGLTILLSDHVKGLQVCKDGAWVTVDPLPHAFVINIGDQIQVYF